MSAYTTEVRYICENAAGLKQSTGYADVGKTIQAAIPSIFNFDFPIFDESYRNVLETKILKHYYTREIAFETVGLWKLKLDTKLNEIMPYFNDLYNASKLLVNPFQNVDLTKTHEGNQNDNESATSKDSGSNSSARSTTGNDTENQNTTSNATDDTNNTKNTSNTFETTRNKTENLTIDKSNTTDTTAGGESTLKVESTGRNDVTTNSTDTSNSTGSTSDKQISDRVLATTTGNGGNTSNNHVELFNDTPQGYVPTGNVNDSMDFAGYLTSAKRVTDIGEQHSTGHENTSDGLTATTDGTSSATVEATGKTTSLTDLESNSTTTGSTSDTGKTVESGTDTHTGDYTDTGKDTNNGLEKNTGKAVHSGSESTDRTATRIANETGTSEFSSTNDKNRTLTSTNAYIETIKGKDGGKAYIELWSDFQKSIINIDMMVIQSLEDLFFQLW